jgi:hypothetical protein
MTMKFWLIFLTLALLPFHGLAEDRGFCPPAPPPSAAPKAVSPTANKNSITLLTVVSDKGYVCSAEVIHGLDKTTNADAVKVVRTWRFTPGNKDGHAVPTEITVRINYHRDDQGNIVLDLNPPQTTPPEHR